MSSKFSAYLVAFLLLISGSLTAATIVDSAPDARPVYQKPAPMGALAWIQHLEDERDQADIEGDYAVKFFHGQDGIVKDIPQAVETMREAAALGNADAIRNLPLILSDYAGNYFYGRNGIVRDTLKSVELCREAAALGNADAIRIPPIMIAQAGGSR